VDASVHLERDAEGVPVHQRAPLMRLDVSVSRRVKGDRGGRRAEVEWPDRLPLVGDEPLRMRSPLIELALELDWNAREPLERRDPAVEVRSRAVDPRADEETRAVEALDPAFREGVERDDRFVDEHRHGVHVEYEVARVPSPRLQRRTEASRRRPPPVRQRRHGSAEVEPARRTRPRAQGQREREELGLDERLTAGHRSVGPEDDADREPPRVGGQSRDVDVTLALRAEVHRRIGDAERRGARAVGDTRGVGRA
jgi:hypothetical protein